MNTIKRIAASGICILLLGATTATDRVGFPEHYRSNLKLLSFATRTQEPAVMTVYGNDLAASVTRADQLPYPNGSVIVMEFANTLQDAAHQPIRSAKGELQPGEIAHIDVMRRGSGFGASYGANRAGEWEFMSYHADGSNNASANPSDCAACHAKAGAAKDFVYRIRP
jgi:hypothetical protein